MEEDTVCEPKVVELYHQYQGRLKEYGVTLSPYKDTFKLSTGKGPSTYVKTIHEVVIFYNGFSASIEQEATKRERLIQLLMSENKEYKESVGSTVYYKPGVKSVFSP